MILNLQSKPVPSPWSGDVSLFQPIGSNLLAEDGAVLLNEDGSPLLAE